MKILRYFTKNMIQILSIGQKEQEENIKIVTLFLCYIPS